MKTVPAWARSGLGSSKSINNNKKLPFYNAFCWIPPKALRFTQHTREILCSAYAAECRSPCRSMSIWGSFVRMLFRGYKQQAVKTLCSMQNEKKNESGSWTCGEHWRLKEKRPKIGEWQFNTFFLRALHAHLQREFDCSDGLQAGREAIDSERNLDHSRGHFKLVDKSPKYTHASTVECPTKTCNFRSV